MKTFEFQTTIGPNQTVTLPPEVASQVPHDQTVRVVIVVGKDEEDADWERLSLEHFFKGYDPGDAIYNEIPTR